MSLKSDFVIQRLNESKGDTKPLYTVEAFQEFCRTTNSKGNYESYTRFVRRVAKAWKYEDSKKEGEKEGLVGSVKETIDKSGNVKLATEFHSKEFRTAEEMAKYADIDLKIWRAKKQISNYWGNDGNPNWQLKVEWERTPFPSREDVVEEFKKAVKNHKPKYDKVVYEKNIFNKDLMMEIAIFDHHFGQLSYKEETRSDDYNMEVAEKLMVEAIQSFLSRTSHLEISKILFPVGNDFFNVNSSNNQTFAGTPQDEDGKWKYTYVRGRSLLVRAIDMLRQFAPVHVLVIPGNHDPERTFYLGDALECWYNGVNGVIVDNNFSDRKYYKWGNSLLGFTHGDKEKKGTLYMKMVNEESENFAKTKYHEFHLGHLHHSSTKVYQVMDEDQGLRERILPSLVAPDSWHSNKGYSAIRESVALIWDKKYGNTMELKFHTEMIKDN